MSQPCYGIVYTHTKFFEPVDEKFFSDILSLLYYKKIIYDPKNILSIFADWAGFPICYGGDYCLRKDKRIPSCNIKDLTTDEIVIKERFPENYNLALKGVSKLKELLIENYPDMNLDDYDQWEFIIIEDSD